MSDGSRFLIALIGAIICFGVAIAVSRRKLWNWEVDSDQGHAPETPELARMLDQQRTLRALFASWFRKPLPREPNGTTKTDASDTTASAE